METLKPQDLRIGNLLNFDDLHGYISVEKVTSFYEDMWIDGNTEWIVETENFEGELLSGFKPIELTEEWLIKFGFVKYDKNSGHSYIHYGVKINREYDSKVFYYEHWMDTKSGFELDIISVHQLQNLFYSLCGIELTIETNKP